VSDVNRSMARMVPRMRRLPGGLSEAAPTSESPLEHSYSDDFLDQLTFSLSTIDLQAGAAAIAAELANFFSVDYCHLTVLADEPHLAPRGEFHRAGIPSFTRHLADVSSWGVLTPHLERGYLIASGWSHNGDEHEGIFRAWGFGSYAAVPIISHDRLAAIVGLGTLARGRAWSEGDAAMLRRIVLPLAIAVDNSILHAERQEKLRETESLYAVAKALLSPLPLKELLPAILEVLSREFNLSTTAIGLYDAKRGGIVINASRGYPPGALDGYPLIPVSIGIVGWVMRTGTAVRSGDVTADPRYLPVAPEIRSEICVPLEVKTETGTRERIGVLNAESSLPNAFTARDLEVFRSVAAQVALVIRYQQLLSEREDMVDQLEGSLREFARSLGRAIEKRDGTTSGHVARTEDMARTIAQRLELPGATKENLVYGCALHDVGKLGIPDSILLKPGPLDHDEWDVMRRHPAIGAEIVGPIRRFQSIAPIILHHQEKFDGTGYPAGLAGESIPVESRIIAVIDAYDAMISKRPYNTPKSHDEAIAELRRCSGTQFDPRVVEAFIAEVEQPR
jgi:GAF domain-containing protein